MNGHDGSVSSSLHQYTKNQGVALLMCHSLQWFCIDTWVFPSATRTDHRLVCATLKLAPVLGPNICNLKRFPGFLDSLFGGKVVDFKETFGRWREHDLFL